MTFQQVAGEKRLETLTRFQRLSSTLCAIDFREYKRNMFLVVVHSIVRREIYERQS
jgi:hypothetical protein